MKGIIVILILLIAGCNYAQNNYNQDNTTPTNATNAANLSVIKPHPTETKDLNLNQTGAANTKSSGFDPEDTLEGIDYSSQNQVEINLPGCENTTFSICQAIKRNPEIRQCINRDVPMQLFCAAIVDHNETFCMDMVNMVDRAHCFAFTQSNGSICGYIEQESGRNWCYFDYGKNSQDKAICNMVTDPIMRKTCNAVIDRSPEGCRLSDGSYEFECIEPIADFLNNASICNLTKESDRCKKELGHGH